MGRKGKGRETPNFGTFEGSCLRKCATKSGIFPRLSGYAFLSTPNLDVISNAIQITTSDNQIAHEILLIFLIHFLYRIRFNSVAFRMGNK
jgi:hypothetical protein